MKADGSIARPVTFGNGNDYSPAVSPNGRLVVFDTVHTTGDGLQVINTNGTNQIQITRDDSIDHDTGPKWSPDGQHIVFARYTGVTPHLRAIDANGRHGHAIGKLVGYTPTYTANGRRIIYSYGKNERGGLYSVRLDGTGKRRITTRVGDKQPSVSPNGKQILFIRDVPDAAGDYYDIYRSDLDGRHQLALTTGVSDNYAPTWSPDGKRIAWESDRSGQDKIWVMRAGGTHARQLTGSSESQDWSPSWSVTP